MLNSYGLGLEDVRTALAAANANRPKGELAERRPHLVARHHRSAAQGRRVPAADRRLPQRRRRCASPTSPSVTDSVENIRTGGLANGKPAVLLIIFRQPGANIIDTVDRIRAVLPQLAGVDPAGDRPAGRRSTRTTTIRASVHDVELTLLISIVLVILVVFVFLRRRARRPLIPSVAVPLSLIGTFGVMYLLGYSLDNLSLMALTISTGFVVDDAIVVIENITRHLEQGMPPLRGGAARARKEIGFTVLSISVSLVAVFIPILLMGGIVGRLFREFAVDAVGRHRRLAGRLADRRRR